MVSPKRILPAQDFLHYKAGKDLPLELILILQKLFTKALKVLLPSSWAIHLKFFMAACIFQNSSQLRAFLIGFAL